MSDKGNKNPITVKEEEIDLGKLFSLIGNAFSKLFKFLGILLKGIFHYLILLLIFLREHLVKLGISIALGVTVGFVFDYISPNKYSYDMIIEPNYESIHQIFEKVEYYNVLINEEDSIALSKHFGISFHEANSLVKFELNAYETKKDQIMAYDEFIKNTDTLTQYYFSFSDFASEGPSQFDSKRYIYRIYSEINNLLIVNYEKQILEDVEKNVTIQKRKKIKLYTLKLDSLAARGSLREIDSLRNLYKKVTLLELENEQLPNSSSTYLDFSKNAETKNNDLALFNISKELNNKLIEIERAKETSTDVVNVITDFNPVGNNRKLSFIESKEFILGVWFGGVVLAFLLLKRLNIYLSRYKEQNTY